MKIWILNHYATDMFFDKAGRHHGFAKYLIRDGHEVKIFCANTVHNSDLTINIEQGILKEKIGADDVPYVFIKARPYKGNGKDRILNMVDYTIHLKDVLRIYIEKEGFPDVVLASSVHPLTLVAGIRFAKRATLPCICEVRDLWPLSIVEYSRLTNKNLIIKLLYSLEHWIYKNADALVFSFSGGKKYVLEKKWDNDVSLDKIHYINTGIDLEQYQENRNKYIYSDIDIDDENTFKLIYTGSIRKANNVETIVNAAQIIQEKHPNVKFLIYGDGDEREKLEKKCESENIKNVVFKGRVEKEKIPGILEKADILLVTVGENKLARFGVSWNKLFEYMASGKPIIANDITDIISDNNIGRAERFKDIHEFISCIEDYLVLDEATLRQLSIRSKNIIKDKYDCKELSRRIIDIASNIMDDKKNYNKRSFL